MQSFREHKFVCFKRTSCKTSTQTERLQAIFYVILFFKFLFFTGIKDVIIWGNISGNNYVDLRKAKVYRYESAIWGPPHYSRPVLSLLFDRYGISLSDVI